MDAKVEVSREMEADIDTSTFPDFNLSFAEVGVVSVVASVVSEGATFDDTAGLVQTLIVHGTVEDKGLEYSRISEVRDTSLSPGVLAGRLTFSHEVARDKDAVIATGVGVVTGVELTWLPAEPERDVPLEELDPVLLGNAFSKADVTYSTSSS